MTIKVRRVYIIILYSDDFKTDYFFFLLSIHLNNAPYYYTSHRISRILNYIGYRTKYDEFDSGIIFGHNNMFGVIDFNLTNKKNTNKLWKKKFKKLLHVYTIFNVSFTSKYEEFNEMMFFFCDFY